MDRKSIIIVASAILLLVVVQVASRKIFPDVPVPHAAAVTNAPAQSEPGRVVDSPVTPSIGAPTAPRANFSTNVAEETITVSSDRARYTFTSHGGGLKSVELTQYPETISRQSAKNPLTNGVATLNTRAPAPVMAILGDTNIQGDGIFALTQTANGVRAEKLLPGGLRVVKEFQVASNYLVSATVRVENTTAAALAVPAREVVVGTATPMAPDDNGQQVGVVWFDGQKTDEKLTAWFENKSFMSCSASVPHAEYRAGITNVVWVAVHNQFFALVAMPKVPAQQFVSRPVELPRPPEEEIPLNMRDKPTPKGFQTALVEPAVTLQAGQSVTNEIEFFAGPKEYQTLASIAARFNNGLDRIMGFGFFGFFSKALLLGMNWLHNTLSLSYGWAIIAITLIIKTITWPLTAASTRSMKRMQALQPQMKAIADKYKDDPAKKNQKTMEFMRENKVNPMGGCLPMLIQMPVFFGFFTMIRTAIELRGASFLWVTDLAKPDTLFVIPGLNIPFNLLPLLMGGTMLWQSHQTPPSPGMDPAQQKMMRYMPLMFLVFLYNYPAGLALYWTVQNLLTIVQTRLTKTSAPVAAVAAASNVPPPKKWK